MNEYRHTIALAVSVGVLWFFQPTKPVIQHNPAPHTNPAVVELAGRLDSIEVKLSESPSSDAAPTANADLAAAIEATQTVRALLDNVPTKQYVDAQIEVVNQQSELYMDSATALQAALEAFADSGLATLDVAAMKKLQSHQETVSNPQLKKDATDLTNRLAAVEKASGTAQKDSTDLTNRLAAVERLGQDLVKLQELESTLTTLKDSIASLRAEPKITSKDVQEAISESNSALEAKMESLLSQLGEYAKGSALAEQSGRLTELGKNIDSIRDSNASLLVKIAETDSAIAASAKNVASHERAIKVLGENQEKLAESYSSLYESIILALDQIKEIKGGGGRTEIKKIKKPLVRA